MDPTQQFNPLISTNKTSDSRLLVQLHPTVILNISDYITRHTVRQQEGPIVGAIIGSQDGRTITMEHAFECKLSSPSSEMTDSSSDEQLMLDEEWFAERLQQFKEVHKMPTQLDLVGWFTLSPQDGPREHQLPIHRWLLANYNESALLLTFHSSSLSDGVTSSKGSSGAKLPLTIYETIYESSDTTTTDSSNDQQMQQSGETSSAAQMVLKFQEIPYNIETSEAEMIAVDFVAQGGGNATTSTSTQSDIQKQQQPGSSKTSKSKAKAPGTEDTQTNGTITTDQFMEKLQNDPTLNNLSPQDETLISSLTSKSNAIKMLQSRITLMKKYLQSMPPSYLNTPPPSTDTDPSKTTTPINPDQKIDYTVLREIQSLLARLPLLTRDIDLSTPQPTSNGIPNGTSTSTSSTTQNPTSTEPSYNTARSTEKSDTSLTTLLSTLGSTLQHARTMGKKASIFEEGRKMNANKRRPEEEAYEHPSGGYMNAEKSDELGVDWGPGSSSNRMRDGEEWVNGGLRMGDLQEEDWEDVDANV